MSTPPKQTNRPDLREQVRQTLNRYQMIQPHDSILVGVSGGPDSVALLQALFELSDELSLTLGVVHVNHQLRAGEADRDESFVAELAQKMGLPFYSRKIDVQAYRRESGRSLEDAARKLRYDVFFQIMRDQGYMKIATAHHQEDNAEQILMNLIRGSGKSGLSGIPPVRQNVIIRPLIRTSRTEIMTYLSQNHLRFRMDSTNTDTNFLRNRIRHDLIPELQRYNPGIVNSVNRLGDIIQTEESWIDAMVEEETRKTIRSQSPAAIIISASEFTEKPLPLRRRMARKIIQTLTGNLQKITLDHVDSILQMISNASDRTQLHLPDNLLVCVNQNQVDFRLQKRVARPRKPDKEQCEFPAFLYRVAAPDQLPQTILIHETGSSIRLSIQNPADLQEWKNSNPHIALLDLAAIRFPLTIRNRMTGDRFTPLGMTGTQKVATCFINQKVPPIERAQCPILLGGDRILWVAGYRIDNSVKITSRTNTILRVELLLA